jgi:general secretion pathway protein G
MVELLVVLAILALLVALLLPAIQAAIRSAKSGAVQAEISMLAQALADFKSKFGDYPPSRVVLNENGYLPVGTAAVPSGASADITVSQLSTRTVTAMRKFWPRAPFILGSPPSNTATTVPPIWFDFNGSGAFEGGPGKDFVLQGHECLVFFLGGIPLKDATTGLISVTGFSKNPMNPFMSSVTASNAYSGNRNPPLFEFVSGRLQLTSAYPANYGTAFTSIGNPGYTDSIDGLGNKQSFYAYFSTNVGLGYDPNDVNLGTDQVLDKTGTTPVTPGLTYFASAVSGGSTISPSPNPYTSGAPYVTTPTTSTTVNYINPQTFQIISPGIDGMYGLGGAYTASTSGTTSPLLDESGIGNTGDRSIEGDNLTNFHNGRLQ